MDRQHATEALGVDILLFIAGIDFEMCYKQLKIRSQRSHD